MTPEPLVSGRAAASFLGIAYPTLLRWVSLEVGAPHYVLNRPGDPKLSTGNRKRRKDGTPRQPRHLIRFRMSELERWVQGRQRGQR